MHHTSKMGLMLFCDDDDDAHGRLKDFFVVMCVDSNYFKNDQELTVGEFD